MPVSLVSLCHQSTEKESNSQSRRPFLSLPFRISQLPHPESEGHPNLREGTGPPLHLLRTPEDRSRGFRARVSWTRGKEGHGTWVVSSLGGGATSCRRPVAGHRRRTSSVTMPTRTPGVGTSNSGSQDGPTRRRETDNPFTQSPHLPRDSGWVGIRRNTGKVGRMSYPDVEVPTVRSSGMGPDVLPVLDETATHGYPFRAGSRS